MRPKLTKKDAFCLTTGPLRFMSYWRIWKGARLLDVMANGLREFKLSSVKFSDVPPRNLSVPGRVRISIRPDGCSFSAAKGFWLIRRSEEHTSELQSRLHLVCRLLLEKKNNT